MGESIAGRTVNYRGKLGISSATVRLYRKDTGALVSATTSDDDGRYSIATGADVVAPFRYFLVAYKENFVAGITDVDKGYLCVTYVIPLSLADTNQDIFKIEPPDVTRNVVRKVVVSFPNNAVNGGSVEVRNAASGGGSGIAVTITAGSKFHENTGDLRTSSYFWIRSSTPCNTPNGNVTIYYDHPLLIEPY